MGGLYLCLRQLEAVGSPVSCCPWSEESLSRGRSRRFSQWLELSIVMQALNGGSSVPIFLGGNRGAPSNWPVLWKFFYLNILNVIVPRSLSLWGMSIEDWVCLSYDNNHTSTGSAWGAWSSWEVVEKWFKTIQRTELTRTVLKSSLWFFKMFLNNTYLCTYMQLSLSHIYTYTQN